MSVRRRVLRGVLGLYPRAWKARYRAELEKLVDDLLADGHRSLGLALSLAWGALVEHLRPSVADLPSVALGYNAHREGWLSRRTLEPATVALLAPGEHVVAAFDAIVGRPLWWNLRRTGLGIAAVEIFGGVTTNKVLIGGAFALAGLALFLVGAVGKRVTRARRVTFLATSAGLVELRVGRLNRPVSIISRGPAVTPVLTRRFGYWKLVHLGGRFVWVPGGAFPALWQMGLRAT